MPILKKLVHLEQAANDFGFRWENSNQIMEQIKSECAEIMEHLQSSEPVHGSNLQEEIGDLLHAVFSLCVFCQFGPQETLEKSVNKFEQRFNKLKQLSYERGLSNLKGKSLPEMLLLWEEAKKQLS